MRKRLLRTVLMASAALASAQCETTKLFEGDPDAKVPSSAEWQETEPLAAPSIEVLWERSRALLEYEGYALDEGKTQYARREMVSQWLTHLAPTRFEGIRRRAHVTFVPSGSRWIVRAAVMRQRNTDIDNPSNPAQAQWERVDADTTRTALIVWKIRAGFDPELSGADPAR